MTADENGFLLALKANPQDVAALSAYADWLDEHDRPYEAALQRGRAGLSEVFFKLRRKSDGLFSTAQRPNTWSPMRWTTTGKMWRRVGDLHSHMRNLSDTVTYAGTPWDDVEVVVLEVRVTYTTTLPIKTEIPAGWSRPSPTVVEPLAAGAGNAT